VFARMHNHRTCVRVHLICTFVVVVAPLVSRFYVRNSHGPPTDLSRFSGNKRVRVLACKRSSAPRRRAAGYRTTAFSHTCCAQGRARSCVCITAAGRFFKTPIDINTVFLFLVFRFFFFLIYYYLIYSTTCISSIFEGS